MNLMQGIFLIHKLFIEIQDSSIKYQTKQLRNILSTFIIFFCCDAISIQSLSDR